MLPFPYLSPVPTPSPTPHSGNPDFRLHSAGTGLTSCPRPLLGWRSDPLTVPSQGLVHSAQQMGLGSLVAMIDALWNPLLGEERSRLVLHHSYCQPWLGELLEGKVGKPQGNGPDLGSKPQAAVYHQAITGKPHYLPFPLCPSL